MKRKINDLFLLPGSRRSNRTRNNSIVPQIGKTNKSHSRFAFDADSKDFVPINQLCRYSVNRPRICTKEEIWDGYKRFRAGDIVRIVDEDERKGYFAQAIAFITDEYANHFVLVIWLLPKIEHNAVFPSAFEFKPDKFQHAEERLVPIKACEFISKCPPFSPYKREWTPITQFLAQKRKEIIRRIEKGELK